MDISGTMTNPPLISVPYQRVSRELRSVSYVSMSPKHQ
jgi:hypothetical protein